MTPATRPRPPRRATRGILRHIAAALAPLLACSAGCSISGDGGTDPGDLGKGVLEIRGLAAEDVTDTSAVIRWRTTVEAVGMLWISPDSNVIGPASWTTPLGTSHAVALVDLAPRTTYYFDVVAQIPGGEQAKAKGNLFTTADPYWMSDSTPPQFLSLEVRGVTSSSALVVWETDDRTWCRIHYGLTTQYGSLASEPTVPEKAYNQGHRLDISDLEEDSDYHLSVEAFNRAGLSSTSPDLWFRTLSAPVLSIQPETLRVTADQEFTVALHIRDAVDLAGLAATISFDPSLIEFVYEAMDCACRVSGPDSSNVCPGPFFCDNEGHLMIPDVTGPLDRVIVEASWLLEMENYIPAGTLADGEGDIAYLRFRSLGPGTGTIGFVQYDADADGKPDTRLLDHNRLAIGFRMQPAVVIR